MPVCVYIYIYIYIYIYLRASTFMDTIMIIHVTIVKYIQSESNIFGQTSRVSSLQ
jgi:hypothetical protein